MKKTGARINSSNKSLNQSEISRSRDSCNTTKEKIKKVPQDDEEAKIKPLKLELKQVDLLHTLMIQWAFANSLLAESMEAQESEAEGQIYDRCKQLIDLKKQTYSLKNEQEARNKNKVLDDVLSMEYSSLKSVEEDILLSSTFLQELEENTHSFMNRLDLEQGEVISPQILAENLEKAAFTLKKVSSLIEDESNQIVNLAEDMQDLVNCNAECSKIFNEITMLENSILGLLERGKISRAEKSFANREKLIKSYLLEDLM